MGDFFSFLHSHTVGDPIAVAIASSSLKVSLLAVVFIMVLDLMCWRTLMKVWRTKPKLYIESVIMNIVNRIVAAVFIPLIVFKVIWPESDFYRGLRQQVESMSEDLSVWQKASALKQNPPKKDVQQLFGLGSVGRIVFFIFLFNLFYSAAHRILHTRRFYWLHRFHHQWTEDVLPMAAAAVHTGEFVLADIIPILLAIALVPRFTPIEFFIGALCLELSGLAIHSRPLHHISEALPDWLVTTSMHLEHHRVPVSGNYSASNISFDWLVAKIRGLPYREQKQHGKQAKQNRKAE